MNTYSQAAQDLFVEAVMKGKRDGYFLEIGSNHPKIHNNTYLLEKKYNWRGAMVEYDKSFAPLYKMHRPNSAYILDDARVINYRKFLYVLVFPNVSVLWEGSYKPFEDWYVHPELVDMNYINKLISTDSLTVEQIKTML